MFQRGCQKAAAEQQIHSSNSKLSLLRSLPLKAGSPTCFSSQPQPKASCLSLSEMTGAFQLPGENAVSLESKVQLSIWPLKPSSPTRRLNWHSTGHVPTGEELSSSSPSKFLFASKDHRNTNNVTPQRLTKLGGSPEPADFQETSIHCTARFGREHLTRSESGGVRGRGGRKKEKRWGLGGRTLLSLFAPSTTPHSAPPAALLPLLPGRRGREVASFPLQQLRGRGEAAQGAGGPAPCCSHGF